MPPIVSFLRIIGRLNGFPDTGSWLFYPGMLFGSPFKWWGDFTYRATSHEGIDIRYFTPPDGPVLTLTAGSAVPAWDNGVILNICRDFLGFSVIIEHDRSAFSRLVSVAAHVRPAAGLDRGTAVTRGEPIACIADTSQTRLAPHLHLSVMEIPAGVPENRLNWELFTDPDRISLINPVYRQPGSVQLFSKEELKNVNN